MIEVTGDLWTYPAEWRCVTTNGIIKKDGGLVMGGGCALEAKMKYPGIDLELGELVKIFGNLPFFLHNYKIISFPTKDHWKDPSSIELIVTSAKHIAAFAKIHEIKSIVIPRPGCGLGGLLWSDVKAALEPIFTDDTFIIISNGGGPVLSPYEQGRESKGELSDNPFGVGSDAWNEWNVGWLDNQE